MSSMIFHHSFSLVCFEQAKWVFFEITLNQTLLLLWLLLNGMPYHTGKPYPIREKNLIDQNGLKCPNSTRNRVFEDKVFFSNGIRFSNMVFHAHIMAGTLARNQAISQSEVRLWYLS